MWVGAVLLCLLGTGVLGGVGQVRPEKMSLWEGKVPGVLGDTPKDMPTITFHPAPANRANGAAVVVCPGGGYGGHADHEAEPVAEWFNSLGVHAFVLRYRLGPRYHHPAMLQDVSRAVQFVRANASKWEIDSARIGIIGFSAGGHLASTSATHFEEGDSNATDPIARVSSRPNLAILVYPVITMTEPFTHKGSRQNLLGDNPTPEQIELLSNEKQVTPKTPPIFIAHGQDDAAVPVENAMMFAAACRKQGVPCEAHLYEHGAHGFGMHPKGGAVSLWTQQCALWLEERGFLKPKPAK